VNESIQTLKRLFDFFLALTLLILTSPFLVGIWILVRCFLGAPAFFRQKRPGIHGNPFEIIKFRTMSDKTGPDGFFLSDAERLTGIGQFLRSTSLDELPELINVIKGDMSFVGPRPLLMEYLGRYTPEQARRHEVKPGITGWAQVNGRNSISWEEKFKLDVWYVDNKSFWLDLKILFITITQVFKRSGINEEGQATMSKFKGSKEDVSR